MISSFLRKKIPALPAKQKKQRGRPRKTKAAPAQEGRWGCLLPTLTRQGALHTHFVQATAVLVAAVPAGSVAFPK